MLHLPVMRWGQPYESLEVAEVVHFHTGEPIAKVSQANGGMIQRDLRKAAQARRLLREFPCSELIELCRQAADLFESATLPMGDGTQSPDAFVHAQSASTGLPEQMCRGNMQKSAFVLRNMAEILDALTRGLDLDILTNGFGVESRGVIVSYQAQTPVLGAVLPSNSPGVHTLWLPAIPLQIGLALKPGSSEPWTPFRIVAAFIKAGVPASAFGLYPGGHDAGPALLASCPRSMIFGSQQTVEQYHGNPKVQAHGPGFSKILLGDDLVDDWESYLDVLIESVFSNGGRSCINCSGILGVASHARNRGSDRRPAGTGHATTARRSASRAGRFHKSGHGCRRLADDRAGSGPARCHRLHVGFRRAFDRARAVCVLAADGDTLRFARAERRRERVHVSLRVGRRVSPGRHAAAHRAHPGGDRDHARCRLDRRTDGLRPH